MKNAIEKKCTLPNHILMPFCHFIDGFNIDKYRKLTVEAVLTCCLWFNRKARNRSSTWWVHGFVQDQTLFRDQKNIYRIIKDGHLYRSHPCYAKKGCWYDWAYFNWEGFDKLVKMLMCT